jgi:hypothetical protein
MENHIVMSASKCLLFYFSPFFSEGGVICKNLQPLKAAILLEKQRKKKI